MMAMFIASIFAVSAFAQDVKTDYTDAIKNADLSTSYAEADVATSTDWNLANSKGIKSGYARISGKVFDFSQTITLPAGQYKMTAKAAYRFGGDEQAEYDAILDGGNTHLAKLYAETSSYKYEVEVMNRYEGASDTDHANANGSTTVNGKFVPNSSDAVKAWFDANQYVNVLVFNVQEEGAVKIGIAKDVEASDYTNIGAWTLTRIGDAEADPEEEEPEEPALEVGDVTSKFLVNADFSEVGTQSGNAINVAPGWTMKHVTSGWLDGFINGDGQYNFWAGSITSLEMYQTVVLPAGKYTISADFFYDATDAYRGVYATAGGVTVESPSAVKDSWNTVSATFENIQEGEVVLGIKSAGWFKADNVRLEYLGELADDAELNAAKTLFTAAYDEFSAAMTACQAMMLKMSFSEIDDAAYQLNEQLESTTDVDALNTVTEQLKEAVVSLNEINEVYAGYDVFVQKFKAAAEISEPKTAEAKELLEYNMSGGAGMQAISIDALKQAILQIKDDYLAYIAGATLLEGGKFDLTYLVQNPNLDKNMDGWQTVNTGHNGGEGYNGVGGIAEIAQWGAESWEASMSQAITGLPNGKYIVKAAWMAATGIEMTFAANEGATTVTGIGDQGGNIANDGSVVEMGKGFRGWQYVEVEGLVEDGTLTIAVNSSSSAQYQWSNADAFELYYAGAAVETGFSTTIEGVTPAEGEVTELSVIIVKFSNEDALPGENVYLVDAIGNSYEFVYDYNHPDYSEARYVAKDGAITAAGTYTFDCSQIDHLDNSTYQRIYPFTGTFTWTIAASEPSEPSFSTTIEGVTPAEGEVTELSVIIVKFSNEDALPGENVYLVDAIGNSYEFVYDYNHPDYSEARYVAKDGAITAAGTYTFDCSQIDHLDNSTYQRIYPFTGTFTWTIAASAPSFSTTIVSVTPAEGEVTELSTIIVQFSDENILPGENVFLEDASGKKYEFVYDYNHSDYSQAKYVAKDGAITAAGTYTFDYSQIDHTNTMTGQKIYPFTGTFTWTIKAVEEENPDTKINSIDADANAVIYDLSGRRVEKAVKGIYIINGRKVVIK